MKRSEWPAFKVSGAKTIKAFEREFIRYTVTGANESNIIVRIEGPEVAPDIRLITSSAQVRGRALGQTLEALHRYTLRLRLPLTNAP